MRSARSKTVTRWPALLSWSAQARPAGPEPTTATFLPVRFSGGFGDDPAFLPAAVDDGALDVLDRDRRLDDAEHAGAFAGRGTDPAGELGEVVGLVQAVEGLAPEAAVDEVVPLGDEVVDRAAAGHAVEDHAGVAERRAAIHAAGALLAQFLGRRVMVEFLPVLDALERRAIGGDLAGRIRGIRSVCPYNQFAPHPREVARIFLEGGHDGLVAAQAGGVDAVHGVEHALVVVRQHLDELRDATSSHEASTSSGARAAGEHRRGARSWSSIRRSRPALSRRSRSTISVVAIRVEVAVRRRRRRRCRRACRRRSCVRWGRARRPAAGHVFAAVVADALDDGADAAVAHAETLAGHAADVGLAAGRAVEGDVADDHVFLGVEIGFRAAAGR